MSKCNITDRNHKNFSPIFCISILSGLNPYYYNLSYNMFFHGYQKNGASPTLNLIDWLDLKIRLSV